MLSKVVVTVILETSVSGQHLSAVEQILKYCHHVHTLNRYECDWPRSTFFTERSQSSTGEHLKAAYISGSLCRYIRDPLIVAPVQKKYIFYSTNRIHHVDFGDYPLHANCVCSSLSATAPCCSQPSSAAAKRGFSNQIGFCCTGAPLHSVCVKFSERKTTHPKVVLDHTSQRCHAKALLGFASRISCLLDRHFN